MFKKVHYAFNIKRLLENGLFKQQKIGDQPPVSVVLFLNMNTFNYSRFELRYGKPCKPILQLLHFNVLIKLGNTPKRTTGSFTQPPQIPIPVFDLNLFLDSVSPYKVFPDYHYYHHRGGLGPEV